MQNVDFGAIVSNARYFKNLLGQSKLCAVVKNDAYGHGLVRTASALCGIADYFAVGSLEEALQISSFSQNILILLPLEANQIARAVDENFVLTVDSFHTLENVLANTPCGKRARVHIKVESGMNRLGFDVGELPSLANKLIGANIDVEGVFSHFYGESVEQCDRQFQIFQKARTYLSVKLNKHLISHIANTVGTLLDGKYHLDMARVGLGLYGYGAENLLPAKTVTAKVIAVKHAKAGETVGYGGIYTLPRDTALAVVNVGYAKGFARALANSKVKIRNKIFPVVGNICMAMCLIDVGEEPVAVGDEVILHGDGINNANDKVIVYELLCNLK